MTETICVRGFVFVLALSYFFTNSVFVPPSKPDYSTLQQWPPSNLSADPQFVEVCKQMAGYYKDPNQNPALRKTIIIVAVNNGYADFLHNFKCYMDRLGMKFLPLSMDKKIHKYITENEVSPTYLLRDIPGRERVSSEPSGFGGRNFNLIGCRKIEAVGAALSLGYDVLFSDVDIAILRDPLHHIFYPGIDYVHSQNKGCGSKWDFFEKMEGNTGFYSALSNHKTISTFDLTYRSCSRAPLYDDQTMFWLILRTNPSLTPKPKTQCPHIQGKAKENNLLYFNVQKLRVHGSPVESNNIVSCPLHSCLFSTAALSSATNLYKLRTYLSAHNDKAVTVHANWMNGKSKKKEAMQRAGLWITRKPNKAGGRERERERERGGNWTCVAPTGIFMNK